MARIGVCGGCDNSVSFLSAAQFSDWPNEVKLICHECWGRGIRCYYGPKGLVVSSNKPSEEYTEAKLYWDEGGHVTGGSIPVFYPNTKQQ